MHHGQQMRRGKRLHDQDISSPEALRIVEGSGPPGRIDDGNVWTLCTHQVRELYPIQGARHVDVGDEQGEVMWRFLDQGGGLVAGLASRTSNPASASSSARTRRIKGSSSTRRMHMAQYSKRTLAVRGPGSRKRHRATRHGTGRIARARSIDHL